MLNQSMQILPKPHGHGATVDHSLSAIRDCFK